jgi:hypothetical protein
MKNQLPTKRNSGKRIIQAVLVLWLLVCPYLAGAQWVLTGDFDGRMDYMNLRRTVSDSLNNKLVSGLVTGELDLAYNRKRWSALVSLFASYTQGTTLFSTKVPGTLNLTFYQAWARYFFSKYLSVQAGRIEIQYDDERFFEARDWGGLVTSHNAVIGHYLIPDTSGMIDIGFAANRFHATPILFSTDPTVNNYRYLSYLYAHGRLFDDFLKLTFMDIFNADDNGLNRYVLYGRNTLGGSTWVTAGDWDINLSGYYQFGHINDGRKLSAGYYAAYVAYQPTDWLTLMPAFEHLSGDDFTDSAEWKKVVHGFSMLYGNMTRSFGNSGVFNLEYRTNLHPGLNNLYFTVTFDILDNFSIEASYHWYTLPHPYLREYVPDSNRIMPVKVPPSLLHQVEVLFSYSPVPSVALSLDYQLLFPGAGMVNYNGWNFNPGSPVSTAYIEAEWTPLFLPRHKKKHLVLSP